MFEKIDKIDCTVLLFKINVIQIEEILSPLESHLFSNIFSFEPILEFYWNKELFKLNGMIVI